MYKLTTYIPGIDVPSSSTSTISPTAFAMDSKSTSATSVEEQSFAAATQGKLLGFQGIMPHNADNISNCTV